MNAAGPLSLYSVIIPARDEEESLPPALRDIHAAFTAAGIPHELVRIGFSIRINDATNAFKACRRAVIDGCRLLIAPHFNPTVEIPLKAIVRGFTWTVGPVSWQNRRHGAAKLKIKEMGSRHFFICACVWLGKFFSRGDYKHDMTPRPPATPEGGRG